MTERKLCQTHAGAEPRNTAAKWLNQTQMKLFLHHYLADADIRDAFWCSEIPFPEKKTMDYIENNPVIRDEHYE